ncbi:disulfide bond formation protein B [bacterium]|nr:disulfide bond formation protein B [bacterium]
MQCGTLLLLGAYTLRNRVPACLVLVLLIGSWGVRKAFAVSFVASALTLYYSEVLGFIPCGLCWFERIFLYPQVVITGIALLRKDASAALYPLALSVLGLVIALYHHALQMGVSKVVPCPASGQGDCAQRIIFEFGYITFPLMAATVFAYLIVVMLCVRARESE